MKTLSKFGAKSISGSGDIDRRHKKPPPPPDLQGSKKPRLNRVKECIDFNTCQRTAARNEFEKKFFKLMNNSMFGKNLRHRRNVDLISTSHKLQKLAAQPTFKSFRIFHEHLTAVERAKAELTLNIHDV